MKVDKVITNIIGKYKKVKDIDGDGVPDEKDCQPRNTMRQDVSSIAQAGMTKMRQNMAKNQEFERKRVKVI